MPNKIIKHCYNEYPSPIVDPPEPDKSKSISQLTSKELWEMMRRLRDERDVQDLIIRLKQNSGEKATFDKPFKVDTQTPINQMYHHGIIGQKWGRRRFQNEDGSRTAAGKRRDREAGRSEDYEKTRMAKAKGSKSLSNEELKKVNERLKLEEEYGKYTKKKIEKSESWVQTALAKGAQDALADFTKGVTLGGAKLLVEAMSPQLATAAGFKKK